MAVGLSLDMLPDGCVSSILSYTSPSDAFRSSLVSSTFRAAADSDLVWENFLPSDHEDIISRAVKPLKFSSKKELFSALCSPVLIDGGDKSFKLDKCCGKKSYVLSARDLSITWSNNPMCWSWKHVPESRFSEVAELITVSWLEIQGIIRTEILTPNTKYGAFFIMKIADRAYGLESIPSEVCVELGNKVHNGTALLCNKDMKRQQMGNLMYGNRTEMLRKRLIQGNGQERLPHERKDGWVEIELGEFYSGESDEEVKMSLMEVKGYQLKGGLIIEGIDVRPKD